ncbi:plastocyanin/azurin family copper-binding protein [Halorientalis marina]|jgi:plastocyanin|uniref:plastocyanin/azurin family copper-binding protein n=1 Tax=Halorientalis marina TaxID=2931976 RepID=UPI001FF27123|nr:plastocyanin/azurin family copper-binding protein [Halorientalis marina]
MVERRTFIRMTGALATGTLVAGCTGGGNGDGSADTTTEGEATTTAAPTTTQSSTVEVAVGPEKRLRFDPEEIEISTGTTVVWTFESTGHNVTSKPGASDKCRNPEGAEPFASYEGSSHFTINEPGTTYEHEFTVPGEYVYVCAPHEGQGMVGDITVTG